MPCCRSASALRFSSAVHWRAAISSRARRIASIRRQLASDLGYLLPAVRVSDNLSLKSREYVIALKGVEISRYELPQGCELAISTGAGSVALEGQATREPAFGMAAQPEFVQHLVTLYRSHRPRIALHPGARDLLTRLRGRGRTAIVTDGLPMMQRRKIEALDLEGTVDAVVYSWELKAPKPAPRRLAGTASDKPARSAGMDMVVMKKPTISSG